MAIAKKAVDEYLAIKLDSRAWIKTLRPLEVELDLAQITPPHKFTIPTFRLDQKISFLLGAAYPETMYMSDLGLGKTGVSLELLTYFRNAGFIRRAIVFTPTNEVAEGWEDEIKKWGFKLPYVRLSKPNSEAKWKQLEKLDEGLIIGTYIGIASMVSTLRKVPGLTKRRRLINELLIEDLLRDVDAVVYDQSTALGNKDSLSFNVCEDVSKATQIHFSLAGRAFGRDPFVLWAQMFLTDHARSLGTSSEMYREAFWRRVQTPWGIKWVIRKRRQKQLAERLAASSIRYSIDECLDLPPKMYIRKECTFPDTNWRYYDSIRDELIAARGNYREVKNSFLRLRQISSGFLGFIDDDTGEKAQIEFEENPKLELLIGLVDNIPDGRKCVIFHEFTWSGSKICQALAGAGHRFGWLWGGTKNWTEIKEAFNTDPDFRIVVANWKKGAQGLNLQSASYEFFYESPVSALQRYECEGRIRRDGQKHKCFYYDLLVKNSADDRILEFHKEGKDLFRALVEDPARILRKGK